VTEKKGSLLAWFSKNRNVGADVSGPKITNHTRVGGYVHFHVYVGDWAALDVRSVHATWDTKVRI
jgi:hypothetical protein